MRLPPGVWRAVVLAVITAGFALASGERIEAQQIPVLTVDGYVDCGGMDEKPCDEGSEFHLSNGGRCDRGLRVEGQLCVNHTRRQTKLFESTTFGKSIGDSWIGRALRIQRQDLNWNTPVFRMSWLEAHNAFNNYADGYPFPNQDYSLTELLDMGIRSFEWDVHFKEGLGKTGWVPQLCHAVGDHATCVPNDRDFFNIVKELNDWMSDVANEREIVFIKLQYAVDDDKGRGLVKKAIDRYLKNNRVGVLTVDDLVEFRKDLTGAEEGYLGNNAYAILDFPSQKWLVANRKRVIFMKGPYGVDASQFPFERSDGTFWEIAYGNVQTTTDQWRYFRQFPQCQAGYFPDPYLDTPAPTQWWQLRPDSNTTSSMYGEDPVGPPVPMFALHIEALTKCNVDFIAFDYVTKNGMAEQTENGSRLVAAIWSWAPSEPAAIPNAVTMMTSGTGRWRATSPQETRRFLCRKETKTNIGDGSTIILKNSPRVQWQVSETFGTFADGFAACSALGNGWEFAPPVNGNQNEYAWIAAFTEGVDPFINFRSLENDRWEAWEPSVDAFVESDGPYVAGEPITFSVTSSGFRSTSVRWTFAPDSATAPGVTTTHIFAGAGTYSVVATVTDNIYGYSLSSKPIVVTVTPVPGPELRITAPASVTEGTTITIPFSLNKPWWPVSPLTCGNGSEILAVELVSEDATRWNFSMTCRYLGGASRIATVAVTATRPFAGSVMQIAEVQVNNVPPRLTIPATLTVPAHATINVSLEIFDAPGEALTLTVNWGNRGTSTLTGVNPGVLTLQKFFGDPTIVGQPLEVEFTLTDEGPTAFAFTTRVTVTGVPPNGTPSGPSRTSVGRRENVYFATQDPDGGMAVHVTESCGPAARHIATSAEDHGNVREFTVRCEFQSATASNKITLTIRDDEEVQRTYEWFVAVGEPPTGSIGGPVTVDEGATAVFQALADATEGDNVLFDSASCGAGTLVTAGSDTLGDASLQVPFTCQFGDGPATATVGATVRDVDGQRVLGPSSITINNLAPEATLNVPGSAVMGQLVTVTGQIGDAGSDAVALSVNWGDGSPSGTFSFAAGTGTFSVAHRWTAPGSYEVVIVPTDDDGASGAARTATIVVIDDTPPTLTVEDVTVTGSNPAVPGAVVTFSAHAEDNSGAADVLCAPASGSTFPFGDTTVSCTAADAAGLTASASFTVTVRDGVAPVVTVPADISSQAAGPNGTVVTFTETASDNVSGSLAATCTPASGSTFGIGTTAVGCRATDAAGNTGSASFNVTVADTAAPTLSVADVTVTGSNPAVAGAAAAFSPIATDNVGVVSVVCTRQSGSTFPFGTTSVSCTAADAAGHSTNASFTVTVLDGVRPVVTVPANITIEATSANGAAAAFAASAADNVSGPLVPSCSPVSGSSFAIGTTSVTCTASDAAANSGSASFTVTVSDVTTPGEMNGDGFIRGQAAKYAFDFRVIERIRRDVERGRFRLNVDYTARNKKSDRFEATDVTFIAFSDDPTIRPGRSRKPQIDTVRFSGVGSWNGATGYRFEVLASDEGEPGRHRESVTIIVRAASGAVVAQVEGELSGGNVQSRRVHR